MKTESTAPYGALLLRVRGGRVHDVLADEKSAPKLAGHALTGGPADDEDSVTTPGVERRQRSKQNECDRSHS